MMNKQERYYDYLKHRFPQHSWDWLQELCMIVLLIILYSLNLITAFCIVLSVWLFGVMAYVSNKNRLEKKAGVYYHNE